MDDDCSGRDFDGEGPRPFFMNREHWNSYYLIVGSIMLPVIGAVASLVWWFASLINSVTAADLAARQLISLELAGVKAQQVELTHTTERLDTTTRLLTQTIAEQAITGQKVVVEQALAIAKLQQLVEDHLPRVQQNRPPTQ